MMAQRRTFQKVVVSALTACAIASLSSLSSVSAADKDIYLTQDGDSIAAKTQFDFKPVSLFTVY